MWNQQRLLAVGVVGGNQDFWQMKDKVLSSIRWTCVLYWKEKKLTGNYRNVIVVMCCDRKSWLHQWSEGKGSDFLKIHMVSFRLCLLMCPENCTSLWLFHKPVGEWRWSMNVPLAVCAQSRHVWKCYLALPVTWWVVSWVKCTRCFSAVSADFLNLWQVRASVVEALSWFILS